MDDGCGLWHGATDNRHAGQRRWGPSARKAMKSSWYKLHAEVNLIQNASVDFAGSNNLVLSLLEWKSLSIYLAAAIVVGLYLLGGPFSMIR